MNGPVALLLQLSVVFDFVPRWAGPTAIFFGVELLLLGAVRQALPRTFAFWTRLNSREEVVVTGGFALGILFSASAVLRHFDGLWAYATLLFCLGQLISGAAAVRLYKKLIYISREHSFPGNLHDKVKKILLWLSVILIAGWLLFLYLSGTEIYGGEGLQFIWTFVVFSMAVLGITFKLRYADAQLNKYLKAGFVLCIGGASIFNIRPGILDIFSIILGSIAYMIGFWIAAVLLIKSEAIRQR